MSAPTVFLSAATDDLKEWRDALHTALDSAGCKVYTFDHNFGAPTQDVLHQLRVHIDESTYVVHLAGMAYGAEPGEPAFPERPDFTCSYTQFEYYYAHQQKKNVTTFVVGDQFPYLPFTEKAKDQADQERRRQLQLAHRQRLMKGSFAGTPLEGSKNRPLSETITDVAGFVAAATKTVFAIHVLGKSQQKEVTSALKRALPTRLVHSFPGDSLAARTKAVPLLCEVDKLAYGVAEVSFDPREIEDLLVQFPRAVMVQTDHGKPTGYISGFPISPEVAQRLYRRPAAQDYAIPCTSHDADRALFLTSEVLTEAEACRLDEVVWYFDSIAVVPDEERPGPFGRHKDRERAGALLREAIRHFKNWTKKMRISSVITLTVSGSGEDLLGRKDDFGKTTLKNFKRIGFGTFEELWRDLERDYICWQVRKMP